jgi:hypothetical protein
MAISRNKLLSIGAVLYMVLTPLVGASHMPCWAAEEEEPEMEIEEDPEDNNFLRTTQFRVAFKRGFNSALALEGQQVVAKLMEPMKLRDTVMAPKGSLIYGRVESLNRKKGLWKSARSKERRFNRNASVVLRFDKVVTPKKLKIEITGEASPQYSIFSNGRTVRCVVVGPEGEILKTEDTDFAGLPEFGLMVPKEWIKLKGRHELDIRPGDQITVQADFGRRGDVEGKIVEEKGRRPR